MLGGENAISVGPLISTHVESRGADADAAGGAGGAAPLGRGGGAGSEQATRVAAASVERVSDVGMREESRSGGAQAIHGPTVSGAHR